MPCNIMGNMLNPFLASSADAPAPPACTAAEKPCGNPAAMIPEMGIPGIAPRRFCIATMESMLPINPPFMKSGGPRLEEAESDTDRRGLGISLRGRRPRRREFGSLFTGSVRIRENLPSGRKPCRRSRGGAVRSYGTVAVDQKVRDDLNHFLVTFKVDFKALSSPYGCDHCITM